MNIRILHGLSCLDYPFRISRCASGCRLAESGPLPGACLPREYAKRLITITQCVCVCVWWRREHSVDCLASRNAPEPQRADSRTGLLGTVNPEEGVSVGGGVFACMGRLEPAIRYVVEHCEGFTGKQVLFILPLWPHAVGASSDSFCCHARACGLPVRAFLDNLGAALSLDAFMRMY